MNGSSEFKGVFNWNGMLSFDYNMNTCQLVAGDIVRHSVSFILSAHCNKVRKE